MELGALRGIIGIFALLALAFFLSKDRSAINWRTVGFAFALQIILGAFVLYVPFGKDVLGSITNGVQQVINSAQAGISFLFGGLGTDAMYDNGVGFVFAIRVLPVILITYCRTLLPEHYAMGSKNYWWRFTKAVKNIKT